MRFAESGGLAYCLLGLPFHPVELAGAVACIRHAIAMWVPLLLTCVLPLAAQGRILRWSRAAPGTLKRIETGSGRHKTIVLRLSGA